MTYAERATAYARNVVSGDVLACRLVRLACQRHLADLEASKDPDFPFEFDQDAANRVLDFMSRMPHVKGRWARRRERLKLEDWMCFVYGVPFGWRRRSDGLRRYRRTYNEVPRKNGKALALDTRIPTSEGWKTVGDLTVGDVLFDERGQPCVVLNTTETFHGRPCYRVRFSDGTSIVADEQHDWYTEARRTGLPKTGLSPKSTWRDRHIRTTRQILESLQTAHDAEKVEWNHRIPCAGALHLPTVDLPIPPYVLGAWLGDGHSAGPRITCADSDRLIIDEIAGEGVGVHPLRGGRTATAGQYRLGGRPAESLTPLLRSLGVLNNKHIPPAYLRASIAQRLALLQGLMDTDGTVSKAGQCVFGTTSAALRNGVLELVRSLGLKPTATEGRATLYGRDCGPEFRIQFWAYADMPVFRLARKADRQRARPSRRNRSQYRHIVAVEPVPSVAVRCITVSSESSLFLAGEGMVPTHNSTGTAALGNYMFAADGEFGAEVYSGATSEKQAWEVFGPARLMARNTPKMCEAFGVRVGAKNLSITDNASKFEPIIGNPGDGASPSFAITDEYHEHNDSSQYDTMVTGMGSREQPMSWVITTAGSSTAGPCYALRTELVDVLEGRVKNDELWGVIFTIDEDTDWTSEAALEMANPNIGVSVDRGYLRQQQKDAINSPRKQATFKMKHLNVWSDAAVPYFNAQKWDAAADESLSIDDFAGEPCWIGLDLAAKLDLTAKLVVFKRTVEEAGADGETKQVDHFYFFCRTYLPESKATDPALSHYVDWADRGCLVVTAGNITDYNEIEQDVKDDSERFRIISLRFDPYNATHVVTNLMAFGINCVEVPQNVRHLSEPMKWLEALIVDGRAHHNGDPVLSWAIKNVTAKEDRNENVFPRKEHAEKKIDPAVAAIMALGGALGDDEQEEPEPEIVWLSDGPADEPPMFEEEPW